MVAEVEADFRVQPAPQLERPPQPPKVVQPDAALSTLWVVRVESGIQIQPHDVEVRIGVIRQVAADFILILRMDHRPDFMPPGKVPGPIPREAGFRSPHRAACVSEE